MFNIKKLLREIISTDTITVFHGTNPKNVESIKHNGLRTKIGDSEWYMVSTDFESALYHGTSDNESDVFVIEFNVSISENEKWYGYPYFWPPYERNENSKWFALKQILTPNLIKKIHQVPYEEFLNQKHKGF